MTVSYCLASQIGFLSLQKVWLVRLRGNLVLLLALCRPLLLITLLHFPQQLESGVLMILELTLPSP